MDRQHTDNIWRGQGLNDDDNDNAKMTQAFRKTDCDTEGEHYHQNIIVMTQIDKLTSISHIVSLIHTL